MNTSDPLAEAPLELLEYFDEAVTLKATDLSINPLTRQAAAEYAVSIRQIPVGEQLGLVPLEDADNSKPFCYITKGPAKGMIFQFNRGDGQGLRYPSLASFVSALRQAKANGIEIDDLVSVPIPAVAKQADVSVRLIGALAMEPAEAELTVENLLPLLSPDSLDVLEALSQTDNFLIRESVAIFLERNPRTQHEYIAQRLAADKYGQVARPATAAAKIIRRMKWEQMRDGA
mgnify:FL=1